MAVVWVAGGALASVRPASATKSSHEEDEDEVDAGHAEDWKFRNPPAPDVRGVQTDWLRLTCFSKPSRRTIRDRSITLPTAEIGYGYANDQEGRPVIDDPVQAMTDVQARSLRGLEVRAWSKDVVRSLERIDPRRVCISASLEGAGVWLQSLPRETAILRIRGPDKGKRIDLSRLVDLRYLRIEGAIDFAEQPILDASTLHAPNLESLSVEARIENATALAGLRSLRELDLGYAHGLDNLDFVVAMENLEILHVGRVRDLRPVGRLAHLRRIEADASDVTELPLVRMPALTRLNLLSSPVSVEQVSEFARLNPQCHISHRFNADLQKALEHTTQVRILQGESLNQVVATVRARADIAALASLLTVEEEKRRTFLCRCSPSVGLKLFEKTGTQYLAPVCGRFLRLGPGVLHSRWPIDVPLTRKSLPAFREWIERHGGKWKCCGE